MGESYTSEQKLAIKEKVELFRGLKERRFNSDDEHRIRSIIYKKRMAWLEENFDRVSKKLKGLS